MCFIACFFFLIMCVSETVFCIGCFPICLVLFFCRLANALCAFAFKFCVAKLTACAFCAFACLSIVMEWSFCFSKTPKLKSRRDLSIWQWTVKLISQLTFPFLCCCQGPFSFTLVEMRGLEPLASCMQGRCAPNCATPPNYEVIIFSCQSSLVG